MKKYTLCWDCKNSCHDGCSWSREAIPVDGWEIEKNKNGYKVLSCPEFSRDSYDGGAYKEDEYKRILQRRLKDQMRARLKERIKQLA